ncbi:1-(5-phosphoribosyl)-5-[(5-phosphoribosylamino)methylideneamino]imidazole-4-carboxamide isomerase [Enterococcus haemoperoxidus ATCC BAA-382]|uniref:1-(5-phosphoribosyl)-5-[(5-phosphoribosylamino)methylideneamino] imidazole-4-carboxamide isomerase n=1 Tax=Enterococcus haemoperoxidus ATCC BAA-382 TaxID=1158608 RepID=R2SBV4_9ENTE|nr:1-(5-phosphoribosyl)-5-[(5-phosphoribosylamino)methylideneamino]imidazole-4-carboxamide isomerase [Enterococcus haemoperoxidus]EOH92985.1 1-(5-phosphoribosyl)-5-[(5-phosphoribosylamino)methylideneamino]imidazole-4-carboxamide isomerase [Enterococcus haemoperoxidus ATCC BAA-382]EOT61439.1 1-(5-phosphoribosyl)-5-[(5-phosphoribosylamino)methylideneamino]imidazole-4-carboxamide isomerase [Enterococcus haemoperoxidus ATCC BAA-382]
MHVLPAIDIREGKAVRLVQGDFLQKTIVNHHPVAQAKEFKVAGIQMMHVVDLDGALMGKASNAALIEQMKKETGLKIQVGGGIRTLEQVDTYVALGIDRIIIGSAALRDPKLVKEAVLKHGDKIAVGIDAKNGKVAISGWLDVSETDYLQMAKEMAKMGVKTIIYTDITKDGTLAGPTFEDYMKLSAVVPDVQIIASGGVSSKEDLVKLAELGLYGAIVGKAFYNDAITLADMLEVETNVN